MLRLAALGLALLALYWIALFAVQRNVLFPGGRIDGVLGLEPDVERIWLDSDAGRTEAWFLAARRAAETATPAIVYAHGNGELIDHWPREFDALRERGLSVLLVEYPGYGRSSGKPSERSIARALTAAYDWAAADPRIDARRILGYGRSLGGGAICALSRERALAALLLESTFTSVRAQAWRYGLPGLLVRDPFDNLAHVREFRGPVLLLHGDRDLSIPVEQARALHAVSPGSELHVLPCGHNDCPRPWPVLLNFLERNGLLPK